MFIFFITAAKSTFQVTCLHRILLQNMPTQDSLLQNFKQKRLLDFKFKLLSRLPPPIFYSPWNSVGISKNTITDYVLE